MTKKTPQTPQDFERPIDPVQAMQDQAIAEGLDKVPEMSPEEAKALIQKSYKTSSAGQKYAPLSGEEIRRLQERHPDLSAETALEMAREYGA